MGNAIFGWPIFSDVNKTYTPTFSGPAWVAAGDVAIANLQDRRMQKVARSVDATLANTWFDIDLKRSCRVGVIALPSSNLSLAAKVRLRGFTTLPIFDSLTVGDAAWTAVGTPTRTPAGFTCADGVPLDLIGDDDGAANEYWQRAVAFTGSTVKPIRFRVARSSVYAAHRVYLTDNTAGANRLVVLIDFTGAVPVVTASTGTLVSSTANGDGSFTILVTTTAVTAANANVFKIAPADGGVANTAAFYFGDLVAWNATTDQLTHDSGMVDAWPIVYPAGSLAVGDPRLVASGGTGKFTAEEAAEIGSIGFVHVPSAVKDIAFMRIAAFDSTNAAGYVELGRLMVCGAYQPTLNMIYGAKLGLTTESTRVVTDGGAASYNEKSTARYQAFSLESLPEDELLVNLFDLMRRVGITKQFFYVHDPADTYHMHRRSFACVMRELSALEYPSFKRGTQPIAVIEDL